MKINKRRRGREGGRVGALPGTWTLCGQLSAWECHRAGQLPGDSQPDAAPAAGDTGDTQSAASSGAEGGGGSQGAGGYWPPRKGSITVPLRRKGKAKCKK